MYSEDSHVKVDVQTGVMLPQINLPEAGRVYGESSDLPTP